MSVQPQCNFCRATVMLLVMQTYGWIRACRGWRRLEVGLVGGGQHLL